MELIYMIDSVECRAGDKREDKVMSKRTRSAE